jgi:phosphoribosylaminoimidazole carboxylase
MLAASAALLNIDVVILDVGESGPAKQIISPKTSSLTHIDGAFTDPEKIKALARKVDIITVEIEHVDATVLEEIQVASGAVIHPSPSTVKTIQDKFIQKQHLQGHQCPVSEFIHVHSNVESIRQTAEKLGLPFMLKSRTLAYDGRGNFIVRDLSQAEQAISALGNRPLYAEKWVPFVKEIAVMVVRSTTGEVRSYPAVETVHKDNVCHLVFAPLRNHDPLVAIRAQGVAEDAVRTFQGAGIFGVEMFLMEDGRMQFLL